MKAIGDIIAHNKAVKNAVSITPAIEKLLDAATQIRTEPDAAEAAFMARQLVQCTLPHSNPGNVPVWTRTNGRSVLGIQPGVNLRTQKSIGYPYGSIPRLLLFWITTEAVQTQKRRLALGNSLSGFMRDIGLDPNTGRGKRGDAIRLRDQMNRLFSARISFQQTLTDGDEEGEATIRMEIAPRSELWWNPKKPGQDTLWGSWVELGEEFFKEITASPVPVDLRALRALKRSPLALDLYAWSTYRAFAATSKDKPLFVPWVSLLGQFGTDYANKKDFKKKSIAALRKVQAVYPALKLTYEPGGLTIHPSSPSIAPKPKRQRLTG